MGRPYKLTWRLLVSIVVTAWLLIAAANLLNLLFSGLWSEGGNILSLGLIENVPPNVFGVFLDTSGIFVF